MIRKGTIGDAEILSKVEATCFLPNEAATSKEIQERLNVYANHFLLLFEKNQLISFIDGFCTNQSAPLLGFSLPCPAMGQCAAIRRAAYKPTLLYNAGRILGYPKCKKLW